jgi:hypothetical protein
MIEQSPRVAREFHGGPGGDRYVPARDPKTGQPHVLHCAGEDQPELELDLGSFLVLFRGRERNDLLQLIASLLPDEEHVVRPSRFMSRWMPARQI